MRIRHYFGNNGNNSSGEHQRQSQDLTSLEKENDLSPIPSTFNDNLKVSNCISFIQLKINLKSLDANVIWIINHDFVTPLQSPKNDYLFGTGKNKSSPSDKTPSKPKRVSVPSDTNKFSLREITKKMSISMPELFDETVVKKSNFGWSNNVENDLLVQRKNHSVESIQVNSLHS